VGGVLRWLDLAVLALALPIFLAAGILPGWAFVAVAWLALRAVPGYLKRRAKQVDPRRGTLMMAVGMMARVWVLAITIFAAGMVEREAGLGAALLSIVLVTVNLVGVMMRGPFDGAEAKP